MNDAVRQALQEAELYTDGQLYCLVHLPRHAFTTGAGLLTQHGAAFSALILDKDEVTLILPEAFLERTVPQIPGYKAECGYRLLTFDLPLDLTLIGFLSVVSTALAAEDIPIMAFSAYERDHLLIREAHFEAALHVLHQLQTQI